MKSQKQILALLLLAASLTAVSCGSTSPTTTDTAAGETEAQTAAETLSPLDQTVASLPEAEALWVLMDGTLMASDGFQSLMIQ